MLFDPEHLVDKADRRLKDVQRAVKATPAGGKGCDSECSERADEGRLSGVSGGEGVQGHMQPFAASGCKWPSGCKRLRG